MIRFLSNTTNISTSALMLFLIFVGTVEISSAQKIPLSNVDVLMQLELRNHDGKLISYIEGKKILEVDNFNLNNFLDTLNDKQIITINGKKFEMSHFEKNIERFDKSHSYAMYGLIVPVEGQLTQILLINNDAYQTEPGDYVKTKFTFIRPLV